VTISVDDVGPLDETSEILVYRAAQEGVRNVVRHAGATAVVLTVTRDDHDRVILILRDDGSGLAEDHRDARRRGSVGLELLGQLVASHGGRLTVADAEGGGVELVVVLPAGSSAAPPDQPSPVASSRPEAMVTGGGSR
jgi:signal transduction histidine kinase